MSIDTINVMNDPKKGMINFSNKIPVDTTPNRHLTSPPTYKVWDGIQMRTREIPIGSGEVQIGVGYIKRFETYARGVIKPREVAVYRTQQF